MSDTTHLVLPQIEAAQAQKHVTHNEALTLLDAFVHLAVISRSVSAPPATPAQGDRYLVASGATGAWAGHSGELAFWQDGVWRFATPKPGWRLWSIPEQKLLAFDGSLWRDVSVFSDIQNLSLLGINTTADAQNKLTVSSANVLFTHAGSDQRVKLNKNAAANTASLLFQDNFSGRAEFGLAGDDDFHVKVSADGAAWNEAITINRTTGQVALPLGLADNTVSNTQLSDMATNRIKGRVAAGTGDPQDLTPAQATAMLDPFTTSLKGLAPASGGGTVNFLRADGAWAAPAGGSGEINTASNVNIGGVGVFKQKTGVNLEFLGLNAGSNKITVTSDAANNEIDIDVAEANLTLANLGGAINLGTAKASGTLAAARFPALTGDVTTTAGSLATAIGNGSVSNAKLAQMPAATLKGNNTGAAAAAADLTGAQATALLDTFTGALKGLAPASGGGTSNFLRADGTWAAPSGGGNVTGPATSADKALVRFNGATGTLIQNSGVSLSDANELQLPAVAAPAAAAAASINVFSQSLAGRILPAFRGPAGLERAMQPFLGRSRIARWVATGGGTTSSAEGFGGQVVAGTATARPPASTRLFTQGRRLGYVSAATAGASASLLPCNQLQFWRGNAAGLGGFHAVFTFGISDAAPVADARLFVGLQASTAAIGNVNPSTLLNTIGIGCDNGQTTLRIMSNDNTGAATVTDLGVNFPANTQSTDWYELILYAVPNGAAIEYRVTRLNTGDVATGLLTTDLPLATQFLAPQLWRNNGATAAAIGLDVGLVYIETDY